MSFPIAACGESPKNHEWYLVLIREVAPVIAGLKWIDWRIASGETGSETQEHDGSRKRRYTGVVTHIGPPTGVMA